MSYRGQNLNGRGANVKIWLNPASFCEFSSFSQTMTNIVKIDWLDWDSNLGPQDDELVRPPKENGAYNCSLLPVGKIC